MEQRSKEWFAVRANRITGSSIGAILFLSPFATPADVMRRMVREYHGEPSEFTGNVATEYGTLNEPNAMADYQMQHNQVTECGFFVHPDFEWLGASPDGLIGDDGLLEIKCPYGLRHSADEFKSIEEQQHYYAQIQYQLFCTGRKWCDFYQWSPYGDSLTRINFDPQFIEQTLPTLQEFFNEYLDQRKPENAWRYIDGGELVHRYKLAKATFEAAQAELEEAKEALVFATGEKGGKIGDLTVTLAKRQGSIAYAKAVKDLLPDADLEAYRGKDSEYWTVR
jgi:putative phage-type endonuclease